MKHFAWGVVFGAILTAAVCMWTHRAPAVPPLTPGEVGQLEEGGFDPADEGPVADTTPALPGTAAGTITVTMPRRRHDSPGHRASGGTGSTAPSPGLPLGPGGSASVPGSPLPEPVPPAPIPPGLTSDDLSGAAVVTLRQAGGDLWTRADLTCCAGEVCRVEEGAETAARWDRAALCGRVARPWALTVGLTLSAPDPEIALPVTYWRAGKRLGYYGALRYRLDAPVTESVRPAGETGYQIITDQASRLRVEAGVAWRFGG